ncbi:hypothetical protein STEG23_000999, partial [Scotinomys teguina]
MTVTPLGRDQDCSLKIREQDVPASWFLDPGGWSKTAAVRLFFIFPGICTLSLFIYMVYYIDRLSYVEPSLHLWDKVYFVMVDNVLDVFLSRFANILLNFSESVLAECYLLDWPVGLLCSREQATYLLFWQAKKKRALSTGNKQQDLICEAKNFLSVPETCDLWVLDFNVFLYCVMHFSPH